MYAHVTVNNYKTKLIPPTCTRNWIPSLFINRRVHQNYDHFFTRITFLCNFDGVNKIIRLATRFSRLCAGLVARASWSPDWGTNPGLWRVPWETGSSLGGFRWMDWMVLMVFAGFDMFWWDIWCCFCYRRCAMIHACNYSEGAITRL